LLLGTRNEDDGTTRYGAIPIDDFMEGFNIRSILQLEHLQEVVFIAKSSRGVFREEGVGILFVLEDEEEEDSSYLQAVEEVAHQVKASFRARSRDVIVKVRLMYSDQCYEEAVQ
jgi:hypothetical protein